MKQENTEQTAVINVLLQKNATLEYENAVWQVKYTQAINELEALKQEKTLNDE